MDTNEKLTRLLALERMRKLSDLYVEGCNVQPMTPRVAMQLEEINRERIALRDTFMQVVDGRPSHEAAKEG